MKRVGFFGGSFDPIHFGHIGLAVHLMESHKLDRVIFCPAFCSPFKKDAPPHVSPEHRLKMLTLALDLPQFQISTLELEREGPSYTVDTLRALQKESETELRLLLSTETAQHLDRWKESAEIVKIAPPLIAPREILISSTIIRTRLKKNLYCGHLIPSKALDYIHAHHLYSD